MSLLIESTMETEQSVADIWDAGQYLRFGGERSRPFFDLIAQVGASEPGYVADLGCGPGNLTAALARRWPGATVVGVDNSPEMVAAATRDLTPEQANLTFELGDVRDWRPARPVDVLTCNAVLQWVPGHQRLLLDWADALARGGWLAFQLPGNFDQPSHVIIRELAESPRWRALLAGAELNRQAEDPAGYLELLARPGYRGGRLGDQLPARAARGRSGARVDQGHHAPAGARGPRRRAGGVVHPGVRGATAAALPAPLVRHHLPLPARVHRGAQADGLISVR